jgi:hypothetical protein
MSEGGKVSRRLTVALEPMRGAKLSVSVTDATTRSEQSKRHRVADIAADIWANDVAESCFGLVLKRFLQTLKIEDEGELFADEKTPKPRLDKKG